VAPLPFSGVVVRSFVLERERNVIVYHSPGITAAALELGQPWRLLVNHWHRRCMPRPIWVPIFA
jgi:hypothetical protein